jgi:hypothetical protein
MKLQELTRFIESHDVGSIVFCRYSDHEPWQVWAYDHQDDDGKGPIRTIACWGNRLVSGRTGEPKTYTSLDRAFSAMRKLGYSGRITIETIDF